MDRFVYWKTGFTGGGEEDLDGTAGGGLSASIRHLGFVYSQANKEICAYILDQTSGAVADGYTIIEPAVDPGQKRWLLLYVTNVVKRIIANTYIYVSTAGNDTTGDGTGTAPYATLPRAWKHVMSYTLDPGVAVMIKMLDGTYITNNTFLQCNHPQGDQIYIVGNNSNHTAVDLRYTGNGIQVNDCALHIQNLAITGDGSGVLARANGGTLNCSGVKISSGYWGASARNNGTIVLNDCEVSGCNTDLYLKDGSAVISGNTSLTTATFAAIVANDNSTVRIEAASTLALSVAAGNTAVYSLGSNIDITAAVMTGTVTGAILSASKGGRIIADSVDATGISTTGSYDVLSDDFSGISIAGATGFSTYSPAIGTVGNNNSIISNT